jgi:tRNA (cytidine32/uridine32-2'-O)-methyltransferase
VLTQIEFLDPKNPRQLERRLRRMFNRMQPDTMEVNILRGILTAVQQKSAPKNGTPPRD